MKNRVILLLSLLLALSMPINLASASTSGTAGVSNIAPVVTGATVDQARSDDTFQLTVTVRDNNTLEDIDRVEVVMWDTATSTFGGANEASKHYSFRWNSTGWYEDDLSGHLVTGDAPTLTAASGSWNFNLTFTGLSVVGNWTLRATAVDDDGASSSLDAYIVRDRLKVSAFTRDVANQRLYARLLYAHDDTPVENGSVAYVGLTASSNSSGWAVFDLTQASNYDWGQEAYGTTDDLYGVTSTSQNMTVTLAKYGKVIGGDAAPTTGSWDGSTLSLDFGLPTGTYSTEITSTTAPSYVVNATYDDDTDLSGGVLTLGHDGSKDLQVVYESWGGLNVRGLTRGTLISTTLVSQVLTMVVDGTAGQGTLYVDCTGRGAPTRSSGFDDTYWTSGSSLFWGTYTLASNVTLVLEFSIGAGGETPPTSGGGGGDTSVNIMLGTISVSATPGAAQDVTVPLRWTGPLSLVVQSVGFGDYVDWFASLEAMPLNLEGVGPLKKGELVLRVSPPRDTQPGNHTVPVEVKVDVMGYAPITARSILYLTVGEKLGPQPAEGPITEAVGYILGIGLVAAIGLTLWKRD